MTMTYTSEYPFFYLTADMVVFTIIENRLNVLMVERGENPFMGYYALPGGFIQPGEGAADAAVRELSEETGITIDASKAEQLYTYANPGRDPRGPVVSIAHFVLQPVHEVPQHGSDAAGVCWVPVSDALSGEYPLAFDHCDILSDALGRVRAKLEYSNLALDFLPDEFTLGQLRAIYSAVWGFEPDLSNFRRKVLKSGIVRESKSQTNRVSMYVRGTARKVEPPFTRDVEN